MLEKWKQFSNSGLYFDCFSFSHAPNEVGNVEYNEIVNDVTAPTIRRLIIPRETCLQLNKSSIQLCCHLIDG